MAVFVTVMKLVESNNSLFFVCLLALGGYLQYTLLVCHIHVKFIIHPRIYITKFVLVLKSFSKFSACFFFF